MEQVQNHKGFVEGSFAFFFISERRQHELPYHFHDFYKVVMVYSGLVEYLVEGKSYVLRDHHILWLPKNIAHMVRISDEKVYKRCVVYLSDKMMKSLELETEDQVKMVKMANLTKVFSYGLKDESNRVKLIKLLNIMNDNIFGGNAQAMDDLRSVDGNSKMTDVLQYIENHLDDQLSVDFLAKRFFLSKYYFMRKFKEEVGRGVHEFINLEKVKRGRELMKEPLSLSEIAYQVGFNNYTTFARSFVKVYQMSPRTFRNMLPQSQTYEKE